MNNKRLNASIVVIVKLQTIVKLSSLLTHARIVKGVVDNLVGETRCLQEQLFHSPTNGRGWVFSTLLLKRSIYAVSDPGHRNAMRHSHVVADVDCIRCRVEVGKHMGCGLHANMAKGDVVFPRSQVGCPHPPEKVGNRKGEWQQAETIHLPRGVKVILLILWVMCVADKHCLDMDTTRAVSIARHGENGRGNGGLGGERRRENEVGGTTMGEKGVVVLTLSANRPLWDREQPPLSSAHSSSSLIFPSLLSFSLFPPALPPLLLHHASC